MKSNLYMHPNRISEAAVHASRQMWLAGLGAAVVTRDWVQRDAGSVFKNLVKEGTVIESRAIRFVGDRVENSVSFANSVWKDARKSVESTVKQAADAAVTIAQQVLPKSLPAFEIPGAPKSRKANGRATKAVRKPARAAAKRVKRARKAATKRA
jgi:hypothetical protein